MKNEEKAELLSKLGNSTFETENLESLKTLGKGRKSKREQMVEALQLERSGRGNEETQQLLYETREIKNWENDEDFKKLLPGNTDNGAGPESSDDDDGSTATSTFIDHRPQGKPGAGFGFQNIKKVTKTAPKRKYNWRARLERERAMRKGVDLSSSSESDNMDEDDSDDESDADELSSSENSDDSGDDDAQEEWSGFVEDQVPTAASSNDQESNDDDQDKIDEEEEEEAESNNSGSEGSIEDSEEQSDSDVPKQKASDIFKQWANDIIAPVKEGVEYPEFNGEYVPLDRPEDREEIPEEVMHQANPLRQGHYVHVSRSAEIQEQRLNLPVVGEEQRIMEAIHNNDCIVVCGETGSGKTTQVPQFLFESGYGSPDSPSTAGMIGITQPRRVAAVSMAQRVANELGDHGSKVGYQVRFDTKVAPETAVKFMTDGVLLRELTMDLTLSKYSAIIIDEAHERNVNTDILIGVLSRVLKLRREMSKEPESQIKPLKLVIMSATLRVSDFTENLTLFDSPPPVLNVQARQFPVSVHFNKHTKYEYIDEAYRKAVKIHQRLPPGGILIFMTGQNEITQLVKRLRKAFPAQQKTKESDSIVSVRADANEGTIEAEEIELGANQMDLDYTKINELEAPEDDYDSEDEEGFDETLEEGQDANAPLHVLPLYSLLPTSEQMKVFKEPPEGSRVCIIATNVAETSLTIPGIRYVIDSGRVKERHYDEETKVQSFKVGWTSKASADQRAGRAGRTGPGHCYRLYSSAVYETDFEQFTVPEIMRMPIEGLVLQMKSMGIDNIVNFPFPTPPPRQSLANGLRLLKYLSAIDNESDQLTDLGKSMSLFPLSPRFAKMVIIGNQLDCLSYIIAIVSALSVGDVFISEQELGIQEVSGEDEEGSDSEETVESKERRRQLRTKYFAAQSRMTNLDGKADALKTLSAVCAFDYVVKDRAKAERFCQDNFLRYKTMDEIRKLRQQISYLVAVNCFPRQIDAVQAKLSSKLKPPSTPQKQALKQMLAAGFTDQVAIRADLIDLDISTRAKKNIHTYPYKTLFPVSFKSSHDETDPYVYIHATSILNHAGATPPDYLVYHTAQKSDRVKEGQLIKIRIKPLTDVTSSQLSNVAKNTALLTYSKPLGPPYGPKALSSTKREAWVVPRLGAAIGEGGLGWDLPAKKVIQEKVDGHWKVQ